MPKLELFLDDLKDYNNLFAIQERKELIGQSLHELREASGLSQTQIANYLGIKAGTYSTYENSTREMPAELIVRTAILYGIPTDIILQKDTRNREIYDVKKRFDTLNSQMDELKELMTAKELNPDVKEMLTAMTKAFEQLGNQVVDPNNE